MNRLLSTLRLDVLNQFRQGFYVASGVVLLGIAAIAWMLPTAAGQLLPAILLTNMTIATFVFVGGLILLEKGEGTLLGVAVSPLRPSEYLTSKVATLTALAVLENCVIAGVALWTGLVSELHWGWILLGSAIAAALYTTLGFLAVIRYRSLNEFLIPMMFVTILLELPGLVCFGMPEFAGLAVLPTYALLWIFRAALEPIPPHWLIYAIFYPLIWFVGSFWFSHKMLRRYAAGQLGTEG